MTEIDASLTRLGMDYVDLYQIHRWDRTTPIEETLEALQDVIKAGKARYIGASSMFAWQFSKALYKADQHGESIRVDAEPLQSHQSRRGA
jgi:aryl-alcohol dehydrogenase-like predicted oxidoreductase